MAEIDLQRIDGEGIANGGGRYLRQQVVLLTDM